MGGSLIKLKIESFSKPDCSAGDRLNYINAIINPESYTRNQKINYTTQNVSGKAGNTLIFSGMGANTFALKRLIVDGTGVIPLMGADTVDDYIDKFSNVVYDYNGTIHSTPYLKITWGNFSFKGVCTSFDVEYKLFNPDGTTLRAFIDLTLSESQTFKAIETNAGKESPDLTQKRTVQAGDTLPLMSYRIYGDSSLYMAVAAYNNLSNVNYLKPGDEIYFPPLKK